MYMNGAPVSKIIALTWNYSISVMYSKSTYQELGSVTNGENVNMSISSLFPITMLDPESLT
jgi:hypothetical protein